MPYLAAFRNAGADPRHMIIVGIPYSSKATVVRKLRRQYQHVYAPRAFPFDHHVEKAIQIAISICKYKKCKLIILEDGGYATPMIHYKNKKYVKYCIGTVEQTPNCIWRDEHLDLHIPVLSIPDCRLKTKIESPFIGRAVIQNVANLLSKTGEFLVGKKSGL